MTLEFGIMIALAGIIFGWGAGWATLGNTVKMLKDQFSLSDQKNESAHAALLLKMDTMAHVTVRVAVLETKVFGKPHISQIQTDEG
jgi:hypothetical protein